jgi:hypothetical protein
VSGPTTHCSRRRSGGRIGPILTPTLTAACSRSIGAARLNAGVGRARVAAVWRSQRTIQPGDCCGPIANLRESGIRARSQGTHPVPGQAITGKACGRHHRERIRPPSWWERRRGQRPRTVSQAAHPTVIASISAGNDCPRRSSWGAPADANMAGGSTRPSGVVPPNQRMQPDAVPASEIGPIFRGIMT